jgi:hypothetical protein
MSRCRACYAEFTPRTNPFTQEPEELCNSCLLPSRLLAHDIEENTDDLSIEDSLDALDIYAGLK